MLSRQLCDLACVRHPRFGAEWGLAIPPDPLQTQAFIERTRFIEHAGQRILLLDYSHLSDTAKLLQEMEKSRNFIVALPREKTLRTLTDATATLYNKEVLAALKEQAAPHEPYVAAAAVVTTSGLHRVAIMAVSTFTRRKFQAFETREGAMNWLAAQRVGG